MAIVHSDIVPCDFCNASDSCNACDASGSEDSGDSSSSPFEFPKDSRLDKRAEIDFDVFF